MSNRVTIINHGLCNLNSIARALEECGGDVVVTDNPRDLAGADRLVLPGVGSFASAMTNLAAKRLDVALREEVARRDVPVLGICLGMQLLADDSVEGGHTKGLGLISGSVVKFDPSAGERVPHMGWNSVEPTGHSRLFDGIPASTDFYFVHSYHLQCHEANVSARTEFCGGFVSAVARNNVMAVQFHPEKSQKPGFQLLKNFLAI